jgi:UDP-perosamine 4-acetyltransferase
MESIRVVVVGAGGHARVLVDVIEDMPNIEVAGFVSKSEDEKIYNYPRLGADEALPGIYRSGIASALLAVGDNHRRKSLMEMLLQLRFRLINVISPAAWISKYASIGVGVAILPGAVVNANATIGDAAIVNTNASVDHDCIIGPCVHLAPGSAVAGGVRIEEGALLGVGSSVIPGMSIGAWTVVGAGAAVVSKLPSGVLAAGVPAAVLKAAEWAST